MFRVIKNSLLFKLVGLSFIAQIIFGSIVFLGSQNAIANFFDEDIKDEIIPIERLMNSVLSPLLFAEDFGALVEQVEEMNATLPSLKYIVLKDFEGKILKTVNKRFDLDNNLKDIDKLNGKILDEVFHTTFDISLLGEKVGLVHTGIDLKLQKVLKKKLNNTLIIAIFVGLILSALLIGFFTYLTIRRLEQLVEKTKEISNGNINEDLKIESFDEIGQLTKSFNYMQERLRVVIRGLNQEIKDRKQAEKEMVSQSKMAAMGEMLGNIAHQWRQPLSAISTAATGSKIQKEMDLLTDDEFYSAMDKINNSTQYLSQTIDDFRSFFNPNNNERIKFEIANTIKKALSLVDAQFSVKEISIIQNIENYKLVSLENELIQVLINLLNNAKDALLLKEKQKRLIFINTYKKRDFLYLEILDNAGGVKEDIIDKVFEPYFTTKHQSQGTGIGLYMSEEIIRKHLNGNILVTNHKFTYENIDYIGAKFILKLPL